MVISYTAAIGLAAFSGAVATYGLTKFAPGAELVVAVMGVLFEAGKLTSFAVLHRPLPKLLKMALLAVGLVLMALNVAGVSGMLSNAYTARQLAGEARHTQAATVSAAEVADLRKQLDATDLTLAQARVAIVKARDNRDRARAATATVEKTLAERDRIADRLRTATTVQAAADGDRIQAAGEFAAVMFVAKALGTDQDDTAHVVIGTISAIPDILAVLLITAAGCTQRRSHQMNRVTVRKAPVARRRKKIAALARKVPVGNKRSALGRGLSDLAGNDNIVPFRGGR
jgi:hypothetical protein